MDTGSKEHMSGSRRILRNALAFSIVLASGAAGYGYGKMDKDESQPSQQEIQCDKTEIVGATSESITYFPVVHAIGRVSLSDLYTVVEDNRNFLTDPRTGNVTNGQIPRVIQPGLAPVEIPLESQGNMKLSIVVTSQRPIGTELPFGSKSVDCPSPDILVTNR